MAVPGYADIAFKAVRALLEGELVGRSGVFGAVLGGVIGVGVGGALDGTVGQRFRNEGSSPAKGLLTAAGAGVGVGIGAAVTGGYRTVYQRPK